MELRGLPLQQRWYVLLRGLLLQQRWYVLLQQRWYVLLGRWVRLVGGGGTIAVRATRLLHWCGWCWGTLHTFKNNIEILWQRISSHLLDLLLRGPRPAAARKHQLHDPRWRRGAVQHAPAEVRSCFHPDRILRREGARRCEDVLR